MARYRKRTSGGRSYRPKRKSGGFKRSPRKAAARTATTRVVVQVLGAQPAAVPYGKVLTPAPRTRQF